MHGFMETNGGQEAAIVLSESLPESRFPFLYKDWCGIAPSREKDPETINQVVVNSSDQKPSLVNLLLGMN